MLPCLHSGVRTQVVSFPTLISLQPSVPSSSGSFPQATSRWKGRLSALSRSFFPPRFPRSLHAHRRSPTDLQINYNLPTVDRSADRKEMKTGLVRGWRGGYSGMHASVLLSNCMYAHSVISLGWSRHSNSNSPHSKCS
jgi:hypothetical protein